MDVSGPELVRLARASIEIEILGRAAPPPPGLDPSRDPVLGCFVTLHLDGRLRGCIGRIEAVEPLSAAVPGLAVAAALRDTRFPSVKPDEVPNLVVEVTVLSEPRRLAAESLAEAERRVRPGVDGVVVHHGTRSATFLPQVWTQLPTPQRFLGELWRKAGLRPAFWDPEIRLETYVARHWAEESPGGSVV